MGKSSTSFKPGQSGNPLGIGAGRPPIPPELKAATALTKTSFNLILNKYAHATEAEVLAAYENPKTPIMEAIICKMLLDSKDKGDTHRVEFFADRLIGKVKDEVEISLPKPTIIRRSDGTEIELGAKLEDKTEET